MRRPGRARSRNRGESGNEVIEFVFAQMVMVPLLIYVVIIGIDLARAVETAQVARDAGSMFVRGIDFSQSGNQLELARIGQDLGMAVPGGGSGAVLLSKVTYIATGSCTLPCTAGHYVLVQQVSVGDTTSGALFPGHSFMTLAGSPDYDSQGNVLNYITDTDAVVSGLSSQLTLKDGEYAYVSEAYFPSTLINFPGFATNAGNYSCTIF
jgi:hypothetical protein